MAISLFAYGTLMCPSILERVSGCKLSGRPAVLRHFMRRRLREESYPAIVPAPGEEVAGILFPPLSNAAWARLDHFEGKLYKRTLVPVTQERGEVVMAYAYVLQPEFSDSIAEDDWDYDDFIKNDRHLFERQFSGFLSD